MRISTCSFLFLLVSVSGGGGQRRSAAEVPDTGMRALSRAWSAASCFSGRGKFKWLVIKWKMENTFWPQKDGWMVSSEMITEAWWVPACQDLEPGFGRTVLTTTLLDLHPFFIDNFYGIKLIMDQGSVGPFLIGPGTAGPRHPTGSSNLALVSLRTSDTVWKETADTWE